MNEALKTQLKILKLSDIKPNFSELARIYDLDRRTVKKYYDGYEGKAAHRDKPSKLDKHYDIIKQKLSIKGANVRAVPVAITNTENVFENHIPFIKASTVIIEFGDPIDLKAMPKEERRHIGSQVQGIIGNMLKENNLANVES